jgi:hypothetical protein
MNKTCFVTIILLSTQLVFAQQVKKVTTVTTHFEYNYKNDTLFEYYDKNNQVYKSENGKGYETSYFFYEDSKLIKYLNVSNKPDKKNCIDTILETKLYFQNKLINTVTKVNRCPRKPGGTDGHTRYEDTLQVPLHIYDSTVYKHQGENITEEQVFKADQLESKDLTFRTYDSLNRIKQLKKIFWGKTTYIENYEYDENIHQIESYNYNGMTENGLPSRVITKKIFDKDKHLLLETITNTVNFSTEKIVYSYQINGKIDSEAHYDGSRILIKVVKYYYEYY